MHDTISLLDQAKSYMQYAQIYKKHAEIKTSLHDMSQKISEDYKNKFPLLLNVLGHGAFLIAHMAGNLHCDAQLDTLQILPMDNDSNNSNVIHVINTVDIKGRNLIVLDDMLDDGKTMHSIQQSLMDNGAKSVSCAVLCNKTNENKIISPQYYAFDTPKNAYLFGCGMNINSFWSHLSDIFILSSQ